MKTLGKTMVVFIYKWINTYGLESTDTVPKTVRAPVNIIAECDYGKQLVRVDALSRHLLKRNDELDMDSQVNAYVNAVVKSKPIKSAKLAEIHRATQTRSHTLGMDGQIECPHSCWDLTQSGDICQNLLVKYCTKTAL